ncbi:MAG TPA: MotA/TolQ/ExbB proton channel family protein [Isosphaeraceae bacterium]|nr:MotA/TolQ/ExbB proton channel family protein [Isosphaeraceae bacterium]
MVRICRLALLVTVLAVPLGAMDREGRAQGSSNNPVTPSVPAPAPVAPARSASTPAFAPARGSGPVGKGSILRLFARANPMVWLLALCSVVTLGYALERLVALRRERVIPRDFVNRFLERLSGGKLDRDRAAELCRANDSAAARVFAIVVSSWGQPAATIRQAIGAEAAGELSDLKRNVRVLNGTATLAPLLGLLGTVIGMIQSFDALGGRVGPNKGELLAQGISLALVTTAMGLAIAVVSVAAYYFLLNKVDVLVRDLDEHARQVIELVSAEAVRPATDRRPNLAASGDHAPRHETRVH